MENKLLNLKFLSVLSYLLSGICVLGAIATIYTNLYYNDTWLYLLASWNFIYAVIFFRIAQDIKSGKRWAFDWGISLGILELLSQLYYLWQGETAVLLTFSLWLILVIGLYKNKQVFGEK